MPHPSSSEIESPGGAIVVGSGGAGGRAAYTLAMDGADVPMLDSGHYYNPSGETRYLPFARTANLSLGSYESFQPEMNSRAARLSDEIAGTHGQLGHIADNEWYDHAGETPHLKVPAAANEDGEGGSRIFHPVVLTHATEKGSTDFSAASTCASPSTARCPTSARAWTRSPEAALTVSSCKMCPPTMVVRGLRA